MASIEQRGDTYRVKVSKGYNIKGKKLFEQKTFKRPENLTNIQWKKELDRLAYKFEDEVQNGTYMSGSTTLDVFVKRWMKEYATKQLQPKTLNSYNYELDHRILPALGHLQLGKIQPMQLLSFYNNLLEDGIRLDGKPGSYSNRTVKLQHQILSSALQKAVNWGVIPSNPCKRMDAPPRKDAVVEKVKFFNEIQAFLFLEGIKKEELKFQVAANIALYGGLRRGELLGLTWDDVDWEEGTISINKANCYVSAELGTFTKKPKNPNSVREISLPETVMSILKSYKLWQSEHKLKIGDQWKPEWEKNKFILTQWNGLPMGYNSPYRWFIRFIKRYNTGIQEDDNIPEKDKAKHLLPEISFHGLRHTSATLLIAGKMDIKTVSARLGHAQASTTLNIYSHSLKSSDRKASDTLENLFNKNKDNLNGRQA